MSRRAWVWGFAVWIGLFGFGFGFGCGGGGDGDGDGASDSGDDDGGGGEDDGGPVTPPDPIDPSCQVQTSLGLDESRALVPFAAGNRWLYQGHADIDPDFVRDYSSDVLAVEPETVDGQVVQPLRTVNHGELVSSAKDYYRVDDTGLYSHGGTDAPDEAAMVTPYPVMRFPVEVCKTFWSYVVTVQSDDDVDGDGELETIDIRSQVWQRGLEDVETLLGVFAGSLRLERKTTTTYTTSMAMETLVTEETSVAWFAPDVGLVKQSTSPAQSDRTYQQELIGFRVGEDARGAVPLGTLAPNLAQPGSDETDVGRPAVASDGESFLAVVRDDNSAGVLRARVVSRDGAIETGPDLGVSGTSPALASDGTNYLLVYQNGGEILGLRLSRQGAKIGDAFVIADDATFAATPAVAFGGGTFLVVFTRSTDSQQRDVFGTRVTGEGAVLPERLLSGEPGEQQEPSVDFDGERFFVAWQDLRNDPMNVDNWDIYATRVSLQGQPLDPDGIAIAATAHPELAPDVAFDGTNHFVAWFEARTINLEGDGDIRGRRVSAGGALLDGPASEGGLAISTNDLFKNHPKVVRFDPGVLVVWEVAAYEGVTGILGARLDASGQLLQTAATDPGLWMSGIPPGTTRSLFQFPVLAAAQERALVTWVDEGGDDKSMQATMLYRW